VGEANLWKCQGVSWNIGSQSDESLIVSDIETVAIEGDF
jgi:hypothetical protein